MMIYTRHSQLLSSGGSLVCHTYCPTGLSFITNISEDQTYKGNIFWRDDNNKSIQTKSTYIYGLLMIFHVLHKIFQCMFVHRVRVGLKDFVFKNQSVPILYIFFILISSGLKRSNLTLYKTDIKNDIKIYTTFTHIILVWNSRRFLWITLRLMKCKMNII